MVKDGILQGKSHPFANHWISTRYTSSQRPDGTWNNLSLPHPAVTHAIGNDISSRLPEMAHRHYAKTPLQR